MSFASRIVLEKPNAGLLHKLTAFNQGWIVSRKAVTEIGGQKVYDLTQRS